MEKLKLTKEEMIDLFGEGYENHSMTFTIAPGQTREDAICEMKLIMDMMKGLPSSDSYDENFE